MPSDALGTLPYPLLRLIYPAQVSSRSPSPSPIESPIPAVHDPTISKTDNLSAAERLREQMRRDMLSQLGGDDEGNVRFGVKSASESNERPTTKEDELKREKKHEGVDWESMVSGTKKVLTMDVSSRNLMVWLLITLMSIGCYASDVPHFTTSSRTPVLLLVRVQVQIIRRTGRAGRMSRGRRGRSLIVVTYSS
jgi:hypothetical protein